MREDMYTYTCVWDLWTHSPGDLIWSHAVLIAWIASRSI